MPTPPAEIMTFEDWFETVDFLEENAHPPLRLAFKAELHVAFEAGRKAGIISTATTTNEGTNAMKKLNITTEALTTMRAKLATLDALLSHETIYSPLYRDRLTDERADLRELRDQELMTMRKPIDAALREHNKRERIDYVRGADDFDDVTYVAKKAEALLEKRGVSPHNRIGTIVHFTPGVPALNAHDGTITTTMLTLRRVGDGWRLTGIETIALAYRETENLQVTVTADAGAEIHGAAFAGFTIRVEVESQDPDA